MFYQCEKFTSDLSSWNVSNVTDMASTFQESRSFTLFQNMGITLPSKTVVNESIAKQSTIIDIFIMNLSYFY